MKQNIKRLGIFIVLALAAACSSKKNATTEEGEQSYSGNYEDAGVIPFFNVSGPERGLVVRNIQWNKPLSSENPGADCELKRKGDAPTYLCVVRDKKEAVVLTIHEDNVTHARHRSKITLDGKGEANRNRWLKTLKGLGYIKKPGTDSKGNRHTVLSSDRRTEVQIVWAPAAKAVTLIFSPSKTATKKPKNRG